MQDNIAIVDLARGCTTRADADRVLKDLAEKWNTDAAGAAEAVRGSLAMVPDAAERERLLKLFGAPTSGNEQPNHEAPAPQPSHTKTTAR